MAIDINKITGEYYLQRMVPEMDQNGVKTIQTSSLSPTPFSSALNAVLSSPAFRRLAAISQLGLVSLVYPTATHSRMEHALGTFTNAVRYCIALYNDPINPLFRQIMNDKDLKAVLLAALCHDIGQYPHAHDLEEAEPNIFAHKDIGVAMLNGEIKSPATQALREDIRKYWDVSPDRVAQIIAADPTNLDSPIKDRILHTIIDGPIDADKLDYLVRDSAKLSVPYGRAIGFERLLQCLTIVFKEQGQRTYAAMGIHEKGKIPAETVAFARYAMFGAVYWHHTCRSAKAMLHRAVWESLSSRNERTALNKYKENLRSFVLSSDYTRQGDLFSQTKQQLPTSTQLSTTDKALLDWLADQTNKGGRELLGMIVSRNLYKRLLVVSKAKNSRLWDMLIQFRKREGWGNMVQL
ncbi:MAG: HD domain-containing protein, partial [Patescibacteria group bacterium]